MSSRRNKKGGTVDLLSKLNQKSNEIVEFLSQTITLRFSGKFEIENITKLCFNSAAETTKNFDPFRSLGRNGRDTKVTSGSAHLA